MATPAARGEEASRAVGDREIAGSIPAELTKGDPVSDPPPVKRHRINEGE
jgi:hypothetical protein